MLALLPDTRRRDLTRLALHYWQCGEAEILAPHRSAMRTAYERAIAALVREMGDVASMDQLLTHYLFERRRLACAAERACRVVSATRPLSRVWVRDAAFWRRFRQQLGSAPP
jgi:hypothetical protein